MLTVEKAVLQIMDGTSDLCVISQKEMDLNDPETRGFLEKHMGRILTDPAGREGQFWNDSGFAATMQRYNIGEIPFVEFAGVVGSACYESFRQLDKAEGADLVLAQFNQDGRSLIALMLLGHKSAYTHQALTEDGALPWLLSMSAGAMLCATLEELVPAACGRGRAGMAALAVGFAVMMALDVALG